MPVIVVLLAVVVLTVVVPRFGADSRPGADAPPDGWFGTPPRR